MSKRSIPTPEILAKKPRLWSLGLAGSVKDPANIIKQTESAVLIRDKYPKAKLHFLILPKKEIIYKINSIYDLNYTHIDLLKEFEKLYLDLQAEHKDFTLKAGFHAVPSMQLLHMHVISTDMISQCLKSKQHWNSFTTDFFVPYTAVMEQLTNNGCVEKISHEEHKRLMATPLQCNQCSFKPENMPKLKEHLLLTHAPPASEPTEAKI